MQTNYFKYTFPVYFDTEPHGILFANHKAADSSLGQTNNIYCWVDLPNLYSHSALNEMPHVQEGLVVLLGWTV